jgi:tetratricopeptide (TPR) repeat protein
MLVLKERTDTHSSILKMHSNVSFQQIDDSSDSEPPSKGMTKKKKGTQPNTSPSFLRRKKISSPSPKDKKGGALKPPISPRGVDKPSSVKPQKGSMTVDDEVTHQPKRNPLSFRRSTSHVKKLSHRANMSMESLDAGLDEDDPVMAIFTSRNTQKVRFSLGGVEPKERGRAAPLENALHRQELGKLQLSPSGSDIKASSSSFNIKKFMKGALFGSPKGKELHTDEFELELAKEMEAAKHNNEMVWSTQEDGIPEVLRTNTDRLIDDDMKDLTVSFAEDNETRATVIKLLNKARRAQFLHYRYPYAVKCYVRALELLRQGNYPNDHPTVVKTMKSLQNAHFANSSYANSANIVKLGIKYEDSGELVRALKMYTIAYRIRRDNLSSSHPSLVVLLNMLGSIQIKRGELDEAMSIYELALKDTAPPTSPTTTTSSSGEDSNNSTAENAPTNYLTRAVTYREMGTIHEQWGETDKALRMYHKSLDCMAEYKGLSYKQLPFFQEEEEETKVEDTVDKSPSTEIEILQDLEETRLSHSQTRLTRQTRKKEKGHTQTDNDYRNEEGGMEWTLGETKKGKKSSIPDTEATLSRYDVFFPVSLEQKKRKKRLPVGKKNVEEKMGDYTDVDVALTIHRIAQLHRAQEEYQLALPAFNVSLRGMKYALGKSHPNVAAILGNIGNLQKEMGDMDSAYTTYQQVLAIESYRLGLSHPDVVVTLHNIATIDAARGNHEHALSLYTQVVSLQRKLFGEDHESVAVTSACMGDVYERLGNINGAVECYEEALRIKIAALGRHSLEVARLLHKLGKFAVGEEDFHLAHSYLSKAALVYRLNKLRDDDEWVVDVNRDAADVDAAIAMGRGVDVFEC